MNEMLPFTIDWKIKQSDVNVLQNSDKMWFMKTAY